MNHNTSHVSFETREAEVTPEVRLKDRPDPSLAHSPRTPPRPPRHSAPNADHGPTMASGKAPNPCPRGTAPRLQST